MTARVRLALVALVLVLAASARPAHAGAAPRGGLGHGYVQVSYSTTDTNRGFDDDGDRVPLTDPAYLDPITSLLATGDGHYEDEVFRIYAELGLLDRLDLVLSADWKSIEKRFDLDILGFRLPVTPESSGFGDVSAGLEYAVWVDPAPVALTASLRFPTCSTDIDDLKLVDIDSTDDEIPLGQGTIDATLGVAASTGSLLPWIWIDVEPGYIVSDLEERDFSDRVTWTTKLGGGYGGLGAAFYAHGVESTGNGDAPSVISERFFPDPDERVAVLNDQEWLTVGGQLWYSWRGVGVQVDYGSTLSGRNTVDADRLTVGLTFQR